MRTKCCIIKELRFMLEINVDTISNIIKKAREIDIGDEVFNKDNMYVSDESSQLMLAEYQDNLDYLELKNLINDLEPDQQLDVIALMYIGRGDFDKSEWESALKQASTIPQHKRADYLISKAMLADYLNEGLAIFNYAEE